MYDILIFNNNLAFVINHLFRETLKNILFSNNVEIRFVFVEHKMFLRPPLMRDISGYHLMLVCDKRVVSIVEYLCAGV